MYRKLECVCVLVFVLVNLCVWLCFFVKFVLLLWGLLDYYFYSGVVFFN